MLSTIPPSHRSIKHLYPRCCGCGGLPAGSCALCGGSGMARRWRRVRSVNGLVQVLAVELGAGKRREVH